MKQIKKHSTFFFDEFGEVINLNGNSQTVLIYNATTNPSYYDDKYIRSRDILTCGMLVEYQSNMWMIINQVDKTPPFYRAKMRRADWLIKIYISSILCEFYCYGEDANVNLNENKVITLSEDEIRLVVPYTELTEQFAIGNRFLKFGAAWKITGFEKNKQGLITICATKDVFNEYDDSENEIADRWKYETKHSYSISFTNAHKMTFNTGDTKQMEYEIKDQGVVVDTTMAVEFSSSNEEVAVIDAEGMVTTIGIGTCDITVKLSENKSVSATCGLSMEEIPIEQKYSIVLAYTSTTVKVGGTARKYMAQVYYGNTLDNTKKVRWWATDLSGNVTNMVTLTTSDSECSVKAVDNNDYIDKYVILKVELIDDATVTNQVKLYLDSLY